MDISSYLKKHRLSQKQFAAKVGVTQSMVSQWLTGRRGIGAIRAKVIEKRTKGELTRQALCPKVFS